MVRVLGVILAAALAALALYASRFWLWRLWEGNLGGVELLRPQGGVVRQAARGTEAAPYDIVLWAIGAFLVLSLVQWVWGRVFRG
ncbi:MAG: hypothetical protein AAGE76_00175 [Pseudomonadota bacterium]